MTLAVVLVLLGGLAGCGSSKPRSESAAATLAKEKQSIREYSERYPELRPNSTYFREREEAETKRHEEGGPPNLTVLQREKDAAEQVEKAGEGKEPAHPASSYRFLPLEAAESELLLKATCREKYGAEAKISEVVQPLLQGAATYREVQEHSEQEKSEPEHATCTSPSGETWRVKPPLVMEAVVEEYAPRLYR